MIKALKNLIQNKEKASESSDKKADVSKKPETKTADPHKSGGCCGGCGGEGRK